MEHELAINYYALMLSVFRNIDPETSLSIIEGHLSRLESPKIKKKEDRIKAEKKKKARKRGPAFVYIVNQHSGN